MSTPDRPDPASPPSDPLGLEAVDQQIRINELQAQVEALGMSEGFVNQDTPPEIEEAFLCNVIAYESAPVSTHFEQLETAGVKLPAPEELDDAALHAKLWEVFDALAKLAVFIEHTNHFSDRELYAHLWHDSLREYTACLPPESGWVCHLDLVGSGSEEHTELYMRYYADEETRQRWLQDFPNDVLPPHEDPPFDRDRLLPQPHEQW